ncbi:MAG TPA: hypothetical protein VGA36_02125 [Nitriliruptorales bacterium]
MHRAHGLALLLASATFAGCLGGDDEEALGSFSLVAADASMMMEGGHDHGAAANVVQLVHFNGTRSVSFEYHEAPAGVLAAYQMSGGSATIRVLDGNFQQVANVTAVDVGELRESIDGGHGVWTFNVTGHDATGMLELVVAHPAGLGLSQSAPLVFQEGMLLSTDAQDWTWDSTGHAHLTLAGGALLGSATVTVVDAEGTTIGEASLVGPAQGDGSAVELDGTPGTWVVTLTTQLFTGQLSFELSA